MITRDAIAQTNIELLAQMERHGYSVVDRARIQRTYELALTWTACRYRSSGRSLIEHLVGVASIIVSLNGHPDWVVATLAHAAYLQGDFGTLRRRADGARRAQIASAIGSVAEDIVHRYSALQLTDRTVPTLLARAARTDQREREALGIRIADQVELYGTREVLYCANLEQRLDHARVVGPRIVVLAGELGYPALAAALHGVYADALAHSVAAVLTKPAWRDSVIVPRSYRTRPSVALYRAVRARIWRTFGR